MKIQDSNCRGQSLFEVVLAIGISALIITALVSLASSSIQNANFSKNKTLAANYAQEATEWLRGQRDLGFTNFGLNVQQGSPVMCLNQLNWAIGPCSGSTITGTLFTREVTFANADFGGKTIIKADIVVSWTDSKGSHKTISATNFSDWSQR
jgi:type II secretory pathway pseudopilin PulG